MEILAIEWLTVFIQNYIWEISVDVRKGFFTKRKFKRFQKEFDSEIQEFCRKNECIYINSSAFHFFVEHHHFVENIITRATATKISKSNKVFLRENINVARDIAEHEEIAFGHDEERLIKDLYKLINEKVTKFFLKMLSAEQRIIISKTQDSIAELRDDVREFKFDTENSLKSINESIKDISKLSESKENIIADLIYKSVWENDFAVLNKLEELIDGKSSSIEKFLKAIESLLIDDEAEISVNMLLGIENVFVRDLAIKTLLPVFFFKKHNMGLIEPMVTAVTLGEIIHAINISDYGCIFEEVIENNQGTEIHSFSLNKKIVCEEEWLAKRIILIYLYRLPIQNVHLAMQEIIGDKLNWLDNLIIADKYIDSISNNNLRDIDVSSVRRIKSDLKKSIVTITRYGKSFQTLYYGMLLKIDFILHEDDEIEKEIPDEIKRSNPIEPFLFMKKIERKECEMSEVIQFVEKTGSYWLLNNYFIALHNSDMLIGFCKKNESYFEKSPLLFFLFIDALKEKGYVKDIKKYLQNYKVHFENLYEFWNEYLKINKSNSARMEFVDICRTGNINYIFSESEKLLVERLLQLQEYAVALPYIHRMELKGENINRIKKYKAIIEQSKGNQVEALYLFREIFDDATDDEYVVDSIITISLMNNRKIEEKYIKAAEKIGSSRLFMLVADAYKNNGDIESARVANKKAMLLAGDKYSNAYGQYLSLDLLDKNEVDQKINGIEVNTGAKCKDSEGNRIFVCIEKDFVLPESPYKWHGNIHMYKDDAAERGILRKHVGNIIEFNEMKYEIEEIIPLDAYYFSRCLKQMENEGVAQSISVTTKEGKPDVSALTDWILKNTKDEKTIYDWMNQYNNVNDVPLSLFTYKRFARFSYLQFVDLIFEERNIFIRECKCNSEKKLKKTKYVLSFSAALMLYKIGFPLEIIADNDGFITSSMLVQINSDATKMIEEYDREEVASMGVYEGRLFLNQTDENKKDYWIKEAGKIKKYFNSLQSIENSNDLRGDFFEKIDAKELLGICDYDALSIAQNDSNYVLVTLEAILNLLSANQDVNVDCVCLLDWIVLMNLPCIELLGYVKQLLNYGCLYSLNHQVLQVVSQKVLVADEDERKRIYKSLDEIMKSLDLFEEKNKLLAIQSVAEAVNLLQSKNINLDNEMLHILSMNILLLKRQKIEIVLDDSGHLVSYLRDMTDEEKNTVMVMLNKK